MDEELKQAGKLRAASELVERVIFRGEMLEFITMSPLISEVQLACAGAARVLRQAFHMQPP